MLSQATPAGPITSRCLYLPLSIFATTHCQDALFQASSRSPLSHCSFTFQNPVGTRLSNTIFGTCRGYRSNAREQQVLRKVASHWRWSTLSQAFAGWRDRCIRRRQLQERLLSVAMRINAPFLASAMAAWKDYWSMQTAKKHVMAGQFSQAGMVDEDMH